MGVLRWRERNNNRQPDTKLPVVILDNKNNMVSATSVRCSHLIYPLTITFVSKRFPSNDEKCKENVLLEAAALRVRGRCDCVSQRLNVHTTTGIWLILNLFQLTCM